MPKLHEYVDGRGYYIKQAFKGKFVTYGVTPAGVDYLRKKRKRDGSEISPQTLDWMRKRNFVYTGGSGPGEYENDDQDIVIPLRSQRSSSTRSVSQISQSTQTLLGEQFPLLQSDIFKALIKVAFLGFFIFGIFISIMFLCVISVILFGN